MFNIFCITSTVLKNNQYIHKIKEIGNFTLYIYPFQNIFEDIKYYQASECQKNVFRILQYPELIEEITYENLEV